MAVAQSGSSVAVMKLITKPAGSPTICDFASAGRIGSSSETAEMNGGRPTRAET